MSAHHAHLTPRQLLGFHLPRRRPDGLLPAQIRELLARLKKSEIPWSLLGPHVGFDASGYVRKRLFRDREWEMLLLCWLPGHKTVIHDHGGSWGASVVLAGEIHEETFRWRNEGEPLEPRLERDVKAPLLTVETLETIHRVQNRSAAPAVSLHFYSPPLTVLNSYGLKSGKRHRVELEVSPSTAIGGAPQKGRKRLVSAD